MVFPVVMYGCESWTVKKAERQRTDAFELWCCRRLLRVFGLQGDHSSQYSRKSVLNIHWKDWCWSWNANTLATWCEELTHLKRPWCWERLRAGGEGDDRGWDGWMASLTRWTRVCVEPGSWWWARRPGLLQFLGSQRVGHEWATELNWTELTIDCGYIWFYCFCLFTFPPFLCLSLPMKFLHSSFLNVSLWSFLSV